MYLFSVFYITFVLVLDHSDFDTRFQMPVVYLEDEVTTIVGRKVKGKLPKSICYESSGYNEFYWKHFRNQYIHIP